MKRNVCAQITAYLVVHVIRGSILLRRIYVKGILMPIFELNPYTPHLGVHGELLPIATETHGVIQVDRVDVVELPQGADFELSLIDFEDYG